MTKVLPGHPTQGIKKLIHYISEYSRLRSAGGCHEVFRQRDAEVFVISFPKSGRTWLRLMLGKYLSNKSDSTYEELLDIYNLTQVIDNVPITAFVHDGTSHTQINFRAKQLRRTKHLYRHKKVILLVRDPRDVVVSYYMHCTKRDKIYEGRSISEFIRDDHFGIVKLITFLNIWARNRFVPADFHLIRYEDIHTDACGELTKVLEFIEVDVDRESLGAAVDYSSFVNMRTMERKGVYSSNRLLPGDVQDPESYKVRKGKIGDYVSYLSQEDISYIDKLIKTNLSPYFGYS